MIETGVETLKQYTTNRSIIAAKAVAASSHKSVVIKEIAAGDKDTSKHQFANQQLVEFYNLNR